MRHAAQQATRASDVVRDTLEHALGRVHRADPVSHRSGGPAGNAQLTAATGLVLLALFLVELVTLLNVRGMISWHIVVGVLLVPPTLLKTATTGWRILRYYTGSSPYRTAGPPPLLLRLLGPLVILGGLAVLGSGLALVAIGQDASYAPMFVVLGHPVDPLTVHQACFVVWGAATGLHVLARLIPAVRLLGRPVAAGTGGVGLGARLVALGTSLALGGVVASIVLGLSGSWTTDRFPRFDHLHGAGPAAVAPGPNHGHGDPGTRT